MMFFKSIWNQEYVTRGDCFLVMKLICVFKIYYLPPYHVKEKIIWKKQLDAYVDKSYGVILLDVV